MTVTCSEALSFIGMGEAILSLAPARRLELARHFIACAHCEEILSDRTRGGQPTLTSEAARLLMESDLEEEKAGELLARVRRTSDVLLDMISRVQELEQDARRECDRRNGERP